MSDEIKIYVQLEALCPFHLGTARAKKYSIITCFLLLLHSFFFLFFYLRGNQRVITLLAYETTLSNTTTKVRIVLLLFTDDDATSDELFSRRSRRQKLLVFYYTLYRFLRLLGSLFKSWGRRKWRSVQKLVNNQVSIISLPNNQRPKELYI